MVVHDFECDAGHVAEHYVSRGTQTMPCPVCKQPARLVFLSAPRLDWARMAMGANAGPEFVDRFERIHKRETARQARILREHGDYGPGYAPPPDVSAS
jgi:hypothetical protein